MAAKEYRFLGESPVAVLRWLRANGVEFILVGPVGEALRGHREQTGPVAIVPAPYGRNIERLCRALWSEHARVRIEGEQETLPVRMNEEKLLRGGRWTLRCGSHDLDIEACPRGAPRYQELVYEANRFQLAGDLSVEVAGPEDLAHYRHVRLTGSPPEIQIRRTAKDGKPA